MTARSLIVMALTCASLSGCAMPGAPPARVPQLSAAARAQSTHEVPTPQPAQTVAGPGMRTPEQAVRQFATAYINWTAASIGRDMSKLAATSIGQARSALQLAAAQTVGDYELKRSGIANSGTVEVVARLRATNQYVVVTRESTTAAADSSYEGLRPAWHVTIATVARLPGGWVVSGWQPES